MTFNGQVQERWRCGRSAGDPPQPSHQQLPPPHTDMRRHLLALYQQRRSKATRASQRPVCSNCYVCSTCRRHLLHFFAPQPGNTNTSRLDKPLPKSGSASNGFTGQIAAKPDTVWLFRIPLVSNSASVLSSSAYGRVYVGDGPKGPLKLTQ
jgi:hypothetical protein